MHTEPSGVAYRAFWYAYEPSGVPTEPSGMPTSLLVHLRASGMATEPFLYAYEPSGMPMSFLVRLLSDQVDLPDLTGLR